MKRITFTRVITEKVTCRPLKNGEIRKKGDVYETGDDVIRSSIGHKQGTNEAEISAWRPIKTKRT